MKGQQDGSLSLQTRDEYVSLSTCLKWEAVSVATPARSSAPTSSRQPNTAERFRLRPRTPAEVAKETVALAVAATRSYPLLPARSPARLSESRHLRDQTPPHAPLLACPCTSRPILAPRRMPGPVNGGYPRQRPASAAPSMGSAYAMRRSLAARAMRATLAPNRSCKEPQGGGSSDAGGSDDGGSDHSSDGIDASPPSLDRNVQSEPAPSLGLTAPQLDSAFDQGAPPLDEPEDPQAEARRQEVALKLQSTSLFRGWDTEDLCKLAARLPCKRLRRYEIIFREGQPARTFYIIVSGEVLLSCATRDERPRLGSGESFGSEAVASCAELSNSMQENIDYNIPGARGDACLSGPSDGDFTLYLRPPECADALPRAFTAMAARDCELLVFTPSAEDADAELLQLLASCGTMRAAEEEQIRERLSRADLFSDLPGFVLAELAPYATLRCAAEGVQIIEEGRRSTAFCVVQRGALLKLRRKARAGGGPLVTQVTDKSELPYLCEDAVFGQSLKTRWAAAQAEAQSAWTITCTERCHLLCFPRDQLPQVRKATGRALPSLYRRHPTAIRPQSLVTPCDPSGLSGSDLPHSQPTPHPQELHPHKSPSTHESL